jgi:hypothetical protein
MIGVDTVAGFATVVRVSQRPRLLQQRLASGNRQNSEETPANDCNWMKERLNLLHLCIFFLRVVTFRS